MASSSRKKQDEKNLKTIRDLGALPQNKYCFDCNQRGPTYVDVTIGSFVCTKCSGMLRGLTPPHRVKSISMATFTPEEIDLLKNRGNDYCKSVWLGLCDGVLPTNSASGGDEQHIRDFMIDKYERKRYYLDPAQALRNGYNSTKSPSLLATDSAKVKPLNTLVSDPKPIKLNGTSTEFNRKRPEGNKNNNIGIGFAVNFDNADIFTSNNNETSATTMTTHLQQESFANFDDVFKSNKQNSSTSTATDEFSIFDLKFTNSGPMLNQVPLFPKCNTNRWSMPTPNAFDNFNLAQMNSINNKVNTTTTSVGAGVPPAQDKYAALKDLDNALKTQNVVDWNSSGSNGSLYSSPTPTGSMYSSPSPQSSMFGSPSQAGQFMNTFQLNQENNTFSNPFNHTSSDNSNGGNGLAWASNGNSFGNAFANPFRDLNGFAAPAFQPIFPTNGGTPWGAPNPFKVGATANANSNNPFL